MQSDAPPVADSVPNGLRALTFRYIHVPVLWPITEPIQCLALALWAFIRHARDADLFHGHCLYPSGVPAALLGRLFARPSVVTTYGMDLYAHVVAKNRILAWWTRLTMRMATRVVGVSRSLMQQMSELGVAKERSCYVPSGVDVERFTPPADIRRLRVELGLPPEAHIFLSPSLFMPIKGHPVLIEAFKTLHARRPRTLLVLTSDGPTRQDIVAQVEAAGIGHCVRFTGFLDYDEMPRWMAAVDTVVLPSLNEGMPLAILEGFACGKPLVGSTAGGIPELVTDRRFGFLVPPSSPDALASALENAMDRPWDAALLRSRAMEFRWDKVVEALHAVYEDVADGKRGERASSSSSALARPGDGRAVPHPHPTISIIIKALNEEASIGVCIESALRALEGLEGEVILADSLSTDRTIEIAGRYPIRIVQLSEPRDRCCGVGAQLGYQHARGEFIYILDADMEIDPAFMAEAMRVLDADRNLAGVAGLIEELGGGNYDFERRKLPTAWGQTPGPRRWLVCGGLYRREAIHSVGYLTNRNLHAEEEMELGLRLTQAGWRLVRLPMAGVRHYGDSEETLVRLKRRWGDRRADAGGELLRAAWRKPYFWAVVRHEKHLIVTLSGWCWFLVSVILLPRTMLPLVTFGLSLTALFGIMSWKKRSVRSATLGLIWWQVDAAGLLRGLMRRHRDPSATIESRTILHQKVHQ